LITKANQYHYWNCPMTGFLLAPIGGSSEEPGFSKKAPRAECNAFKMNERHKLRGIIMLTRECIMLWGSPILTKCHRPLLLLPGHAMNATLCNDFAMKEIKPN
jgi:hypothetical protein